MAEKIGNVWVFIEQEGGKIADVSLELVCKGRELAAQLGVKTEALLLGDKLEKCVDTLYSYGCDTVYLAEDPRLEPFTVLPYAKVIMDLIREHKPNILLFGATLKGRELAPRVASEKLGGLTADCTQLRIDDFEDKKNNKSYTNKLMQIRPAFGGNIIATIVNTWDDPQMVTVREGVMKMDAPDPSRKGKLVRVKPQITDAETVVKVLERVRADKEVDLKGAQIIVSGGYGVGSKANFKLIYDLAEALGGEVGASTCYTGSTKKFSQCKACCDDTCPSGYSLTMPDGCYDTATTECGTTCYKEKSCCYEVETGKQVYGSCYCHPNSYWYPIDGYSICCSISYTIYYNDGRTESGDELRNCGGDERDPSSCDRIIAGNCSYMEGREMPVYETICD